MSNDPSIPAVPIGRKLYELLKLMLLTGHSMLLVGPTGIGKSSFFVQAANRLGIGVRVVDLSLLESPGELLGLPFIEGGVTRYARPSMLPTGGCGILILEEFSRIPRHLIAPIYELLTARRIGEYELPPGWIIAASANPQGPDYHVNELDLAMRDRFFLVQTCVDRDEWLYWAEGHGVHPAILAVARHEPKTFELVSPRQWVMISEELRGAESLHLDRSELEVALGVRLGSAAGAHAVLKYLDADYPERPYGPLDLVSRFATDERLVEFVRGARAEGRTDLLEALAAGVAEIVGGAKLGVLLEAGTFDLASFERFLDELPGDRRQALQDAFAANPASARALDVAPEQAFVGYRRSALARSVRRWLAEGLVHRVGALMHRLSQFVEELAAGGALEHLLGRDPVRRNLRHVAADVGAERLGPFAAVLDRFGVRVEGA